VAERLVEVKDLKVQFATEDGIVRAVDGVNFELDRGQVLGIVGESGSGKSVTAMTLLGLTRDKNTRFEGEVLYKGRNVLAMNEDELQEVRGNEMSMIFQDPMTSLNPVYTVGAQITEAIQVHERADKGLRGGARSTCSSKSGSRTPTRASTTTRMNSRAGCASAR
jgi:ABC-type dipeptide/oligopeptide/nickel transport system ATPase component